MILYTVTHTLICVFAVHTRKDSCRLACVYPRKRKGEKYINVGFEGAEKKQLNICVFSFLLLLLLLLLTCLIKENVFLLDFISKNFY